MVCNTMRTFHEKILLRNFYFTIHELDEQIQEGLNGVNR